MLNRVTIQGRLVDDPTLRYSTSNTAVSTLRLACDRNFKPKDGNSQTADFFTVVAWRQTAEFIGRYFRKGNMILIDGRLQQRTYKDDAGNNRYVVEIVADNVNFCGGRQEGAEGRQSASGGQASGYSGGTANAAQQPDYGQRAQANDFTELNDDDGELPF